MNDLNLQTKIVEFSNPLYLSSGRILEPYKIIYETYGTLNKDKSNAILVAHALTGSHHAAGKYHNDKKLGWWDKMIGPNKAIDTNKYFVICPNVIGSAFGSSSAISPIYGSFGDNGYFRFKFPVITIQDMLKANVFLLNHLGITKLHCAIGGSMGGMVVLCMSVNYPKIAKSFIPIATSYCSNPAIILINKIMSEIIMLDKDFNGGNYDLDKKHKYNFKGLQIARMLGFSQYISLDTMNKKFGRNYTLNEGFYEMFGRFEIERYLDYNGAVFVESFDPLCYLYLLKALSLFDISLGFNSLDEALNNIVSTIHLIGFSGDNMFPINEMEFIKSRLDFLNKESSFKIIDSKYGHDAFLVEIEKFDGYIKDLLG